MNGIRRADRHDIDSMILMIKNYAKQSPVSSLVHQQSELYVRKLFTEIIYGLGAVWIAYRNDRPAGMLIAVKNGNIWNPDVVALNELCWWVETEFRNTLIGYRLLYAYKEYADEQLANKSISYWTITKMANSPDIDYTRLGCRLLEQTYYSE